MLYEQNQQLHYRIELGWTQSPEMWWVAGVPWVLSFVKWNDDCVVLAAAQVFGLKLNKASCDCSQFKNYNLFP